MNTTTVTAKNIDTLSLPVDQRKEIEPGCVVYQWTDRNTHTLTVWPAEDRGAYASGGDSSWGDWNGSSLKLDDEAVFIKPGVGEVCCYEGCDRPATEHDSDGCRACEECAAKSYEWVVLTDLSEGAAWLEADMAVRVEEILAKQGWTVSIEEPQRGQAEGTYYRKSDGTLQIVGYTIPKPDSLRRAIEDAANKVI